jgi:carbonic anhydrase
MTRLRPVRTVDEIPVEYRNTPIGLLFEYHNMGRSDAAYDEAKILVGMCMDNRKRLNIPENFAYVIRTGGANLQYSDFKISFAVGVGNVQHLAVMGHNHCGMVNLVGKKEQFISGLVSNAGWSRNKAEEHFASLAPLFEIQNETEFVLSQVERLKNKYPKICIVPLFYDVDDNQIYLVEE